LLLRRGTPARAAPAERGRPEATVWRILGALKEDCACGRLMPPPRVILLLRGGIRTGQAITHM
jgi:hypothetical protein